MAKHIENNLASGKKRLKKIIQENDYVDKIKNEAETIFHVIDKILTECLFWERHHIHVEVSHNKKYSDYELGSPRKAIWEAKREGIDFELPANHKKK